jgi:ADP-ribose pyrophosphatase YjhB (NUDIX family)
MNEQKAACVISDAYGRILLLHKTSIHAGSDNWDESDMSGWDLPGGSVEPDETAEAAAVRRTYESTDMLVRLIKSLGSEEVEADDGVHIYHWFQAVITGGEPDSGGEDEYDDSDYFELEDLTSPALSESTQLLLTKLLDGVVALDPVDDV